MPEYIEREAAFAALCEYCDGGACKDSSNNECAEYRKIRLIPAADVEVVRHGEWLDNGERDSNGVRKPFAISCSVCGSAAGTTWMQYCPDCGAKMDGKGDDNA